MTPKEQMIAFVDAYVNDEVSVQFRSLMPATGETCYMFIGASKECIKEILLQNFSEELVGHMPNDSTVHQILQWSAAPRILPDQSLS